jgi:UDP-2-acetamido-3-amino-2,3-dideoxy-glucuronate N-acetyltransferase
MIDVLAEVGWGTKVWHWSHICDGAKVGSSCTIGQNVYIAGVVGDRCKIQNNVSVFKNVTIEDDVFIGPSVVFTNVKNPRAFINKMPESKPTRVKKGATLGANCTIVCGVTIGKYAMVGAGAVVTKDIGNHELVVGNPARLIGYVCECGEILKFGFICSCGKDVCESIRG